MSPDPDRLHEELEEAALSQSKQRESGQHDDAEINALVTLAQHLQTHLPLHVDPVFADQLEKRLQDRNDALRQGRHTPVQRIGSRQRQRGKNRCSPHAYFILVAVLICALLLGSTGTLFAASRVSDPASPLYGMKLWE